MKAFGTDYDGVIINIEPQKSKVFGELLNSKWDINKETARKFWIEAGGTSRRHKFNYFYEKQFKNKLPEDTYCQIESEFSDLLKKKFYPDVKVLPYALDLLKFARSNFDLMFVSSGIPMDELKYLLKLNGLLKYFDVILGTNEKYKSKIDHFNKIRKTQKPDLIIFLADSPADMKTVNRAHAIPIGITTNHTEEELLSAGAKYVCKLKDVISAIENFKRS